MTAAAIIDRLERVRRTGPNRWLAACPSHPDRHPSLSIRELEDGRILLHDHGGCDVHAVLSAIGMRMTDLYPVPLDHHRRPTRSSIPAADLLRLLDRESLIVGMIGADLLSGKTINRATWQRLSKAVGRIGRARDAASPAKL
ncbi:MAG: DNA primase [Gammaproteobacteria bacterium]|nr:DNA primase [Gammaproteobacteria bacterium]